MIQGGDPLGTGSGGSGPNGAKGNAVDDEFSADLRFTSSGLLAMANSGSDTNDCQFFVTADTFRSGDYTYTILGKLVAGDDIRQAIANVPVEDNGNGEVSKPLHPPIIDSIRVVTDTHYGLVMLKPGAGAAVDETATVTVTASDNSSVTLTASDGTSQPSLDTTLVADTPSTGDHPAFITPVPDVHTTMNTPVTFAIPVTVGDPGVPLAYASDTSDPYNLQINTSGTGPTDGSATVTPSGNLLGVHGVRVGVRRDSTDPSSNTNYDIQDVAVFIRPTTPTSISVLTSGVQDGSTTSITSGLTFRVTGVTGGLTTAIYIDSNPTPIATAFAFGSTVDVQIGQLSNGPHTFIARQLFSHGAVKVGNRTIAAGDLNSDVSPNAVHITVQAKPTFAMTVPTSGTFNAGQNVGIAWSADSVPLGATVSLCYDDDATWFNGNEHWIEVSQVAAANGYGSYQWNTTGVKPGTYYIAGYLWVDGVPKFSHLLTPITITGPAVPSFAVTAPASGSFAAGQSVTIAWKDQNAPADARISLAYDTDTAINGNEQWIEIDQAAPANGLGTYQWNTTGVKPGTYYIAGYLWSNGAPTFSHLLTPITITGPVAPSFAVTAPASGSFVAGQNVTIAWKDRKCPGRRQDQPCLRHRHRDQRQRAIHRDPPSGARQRPGHVSVEHHGREAGHLLHRRLPVVQRRADLLAPAHADHHYGAGRAVVRRDRSRFGQLRRRAKRDHRLEGPKCPGRRQDQPCLRHRHRDQRQRAIHRDSSSGARQRLWHVSVEHHGREAGQLLPRRLFVVQRRADLLPPAHADHHYRHRAGGRCLRPAHRRRTAAYQRTTSTNR